MKLTYFFKIMVKLEKLNGYGQNLTFVLFCSLQENLLVLHSWLFNWLHVLILGNLDQMPRKMKEVHSRCEKTFGNSLNILDQISSNPPVSFQNLGRFFI